MKVLGMAAGVMHVSVSLAMSDSGPWTVGSSQVPLFQDKNTERVAFPHARKWVLILYN